ncbi:hypothetical protein [Ramlibacter rhizophilus]|uniref:NAD(P)/FAD-dependent oxidoreductase n=1 Tax=Ramlibacter rhizophilus TaxID=1781167 RepID=A0A4Z0BDV3_9BURK|nr:hypothetical protein [Ramlibacter rhizophilus]TFY97505.1 hypothetical protein EZ242_18470 [Ramlibacter rhizophilus]
MSQPLECDYLVIGTGAAGMAFTDALLTHAPAARVLMADRRHAPGGHWHDAYPFVRLHQPSTFYGVASVPLGQEEIDRSGLNEGFYELAGADELRAYYARVMQQHFLPTGRVQHLPLCDWQGGEQGLHRLTSRLTGQTHEVRVRRKLVDTSYLEGRMPATSAPPFALGEGVRCVPAGEVARLEAGAARRFAVVGAGKTALDTCVWLLSNGVAPEAIRWIKPRESWWLNRRFHQPGTLLPEFCRGIAMQLEAMAQAAAPHEVFERLEAQGLLLRVDTAVEPQMMRGAVLSEAELALLRRITDVVRLGHVQRVERDRVVFDAHSIAAEADTLYLHCAAEGLARPPLRPVFEADRVTVQPGFWGFACFQFALIGVVESLLDDVDEKNRLFPPIHYWDEPADYLGAFAAMLRSQQARASCPGVAEWARQTRLNPLGGIGWQREDPRMAEALEQMKRFGPTAAQNLPRLIAEAAAPGRR